MFLNQSIEKSDGETKDYTESMYERVLSDDGVNFDLDESGDYKLIDGSKSIFVEGIARELLIKKGHFTEEQVRAIHKANINNERIDMKALNLQEKTRGSENQELANLSIEPMEIDI